MDDRNLFTTCKLRKNQFNKIDLFQFFENYFFGNLL